MPRRESTTRNVSTHSSQAYQEVASILEDNETRGESKKKDCSFQSPLYFATAIPPGAATCNKIQSVILHVPGSTVICTASAQKEGNPCCAAPAIHLY